MEEKENSASSNDKKQEADASVETKEYSSENVHYENDVAVYTDPETKTQYDWCKESEKWVLRNVSVYGFENDTHTYTDGEGVAYFWDKEKSAWFPKLDDEFMALYQLNYGNYKEEASEQSKVNDQEMDVQQPSEVPAKKTEKKAPSEPTWFEIDEKHNTSVYVSNLPLDITEEDFVNFMQKCGLVMRDTVTGKMKIKLYIESESNTFKGDALCTYIRIESVDLALKLLDGYNFNGKIVKVERAKFQMKGEFNPNLKPKKRKRKEKEKLKRMQDKLFDWRPEKMRGERAKHEKIVIVKNLFEPTMFDSNVSLILEFQQDLREECSKYGEVRKVILYDSHPEGVAQINMKEPEEADQVVNLLNGRWFCQRKLTAEIWDGKTKFKIAETESQIANRLEKWDTFLVEGENSAK